MAGSIPSYQDLYDIGLAVAQIRRPKLVVRPGDVSDAMLSGGASMANAVIGAGARGFRSTLLFGSEGDDLHVVSHDRGVDWDPGDQAVVPVAFSRLLTGAAGTIPIGTRVATDPDTVTGAFATFTLNTDAIFQTTDLTRTATATCTQVGPSGNVAPGAITRILDAIPLTGITVTNPEKGAGGSPAESDSDLQARTSAFPLVLRRGTEDALIFGAKLTPGVRRVNVVSAGGGVILLYVADQDGNSNAALAAAAQRVIDGPPAWRSAGDVVTCVGATLVTQDVNYGLVVRTGVDVATLFVNTDAAIRAAMGRLQPGETLYRSLISKAAENVDTRSIVACVVNVPAADIVPSSSQILRAGVISHA